MKPYLLATIQQIFLSTPLKWDCDKKHEAPLPAPVAATEETQMKDWEREVGNGANSGERAVRN